MTVRLCEEIQAIGLSTSVSLGTRLSARLGISTSWMTVLRRMMDLPTAAASSVVALGIDDFSLRRGRKFGTILVDLDSHRVVDVLAERSSQSSADWMRDHTEIAYVSRDRGKDYTQGANEGAPHATQISDRFHLMVRRIGACLDSFQRKEGLRAKTPKTVAYLAGKPKEDSSMRQRQTCPKAFRARSACLARHGEARLPNLAYQRRERTPVVVKSACCDVPEIHIS